MNRPPPDDRPHLWFCAPALGVPSEVWMYRQATGLSAFRTTVCTWQHQHRDRFPAPGVAVRCVERGIEVSERSPTGRIVGRCNALVRGLPAGPTETRWWLRQIEHDRPDVALCHFGPTLLKLLPLLERFQIPTAVHFNGYDLSRLWKRRSYRRLIAGTIDRVGTYVVCADYMRQHLIDVGIPRDQIEKIPYGTPRLTSPDDVQLAVEPEMKPTGEPEIERVGEPADAPECTFLSVGRLVGKKRPDLVIRAFAAAVGGLDASRRRRVSLRMIGDGPMRRRCERLVRRWGLGDSVQLLGAGSPDQVRQAMRSADVYVQHSVTARSGDREGWPVAVAEAASAGLPVLSTRHASIPEQVIDGHTGMLTDEFDWSALADHMSMMIADPRRRNAMGAAAAEHIAGYPVEGQIAKLGQTLCRMLPSSRSAAMAA